jgi:hypothetical protein
VVSELSAKGYSEAMAPVQECPPRPADHPEPRHHTHEIPQETWTSAGQAVATAAGIAAIVGLVIGPEGAAAGAVLGGIIGLILAGQRARAEQHRDHRP